VRKQFVSHIDAENTEIPFLVNRKSAFTESTGKTLNFLSSEIIHAAFNVHRELGPGLLESVYQACMLKELRDMGVEVQAELPVPVMYRGEVVSHDGFRIDLLVGDRIIVELKSVEAVQPVHKKQLLTYLRLTNKELGLLINFGEVLLKNGISRIINSPKTCSAGSSDPREQA
jgi:GxxExxY protein